jgi:hypothetical protein
VKNLHVRSPTSRSNAEVTPDVIFTALQTVFVFWMSCLCSDCRCKVANKLKTDIPNMLEGAELTAEQLDQRPTCH